MKKVLVSFSVLTALALLVTSAGAALAPPMGARSPADWNIASGGAGYYANATYPTGEPAPAGWGPIFNYGAQVGDEERAVISVHTLVNDTNYAAVAPTYGTLTGLQYGLQVVDITPDPVTPGDILVYLGNSIRNPIPGGQPAGTSGAWVFYQNSSPVGNPGALYNPGLSGTAPEQWVEGDGTFDTYPGTGPAATSTVWLYGAFQNVGTAPNGAPIVGVETINPALGQGWLGSSATNFDTGLQLLVAGGSASGVVGVGTTITYVPQLWFPTPAASHDSYYHTTAQAGNWAVYSTDDFYFEAATAGTLLGMSVSAGDEISGTTDDASSLYTAPEPMAAIFFGTGVIGVFGYVARRKMQGN